MSGYPVISKQGYKSRLLSEMLNTLSATKTLFCDTFHLRVGSRPTNRFAISCNADDTFNVLKRVLKSMYFHNIHIHTTPQAGC